MKNIFRYLFIALLSFAVGHGAYADKFHGHKGGTKSTREVKSTAAGCLPGAAFKYLEINNVRTQVHTGGDMWWNFEDADYEIPAGSGKMSLFSASLWLGGVDVNNQLKLAAVRYRQGPNSGSPGVGNDYWPGPLTIDGTASITGSVCAEYDKMWYITREEVDEYLAWWDAKDEFPDYVIPKSITNWPAHGKTELNQSYYLAPFFDYDGDGDYDPTQGDYPYYDIGNQLCKSDEVTLEGNGILADQVIKGDGTLWWVFNDKGNYHSETEGQSIGVEIRGQAFGFSTNDEINNMTFYSYEIINRSTFALADTYFSQWVDTDLGFATDDYVGCDVLRGLGYCYNGKPVDGNGQAWAYGNQPPAVGVDFFQGPYMDNDNRDNPKFTGDNCDIIFSTDTLDQMAINGVNFGDGIVDNERFGMRRFVYHNNSGSGVPQYMQDPDRAPEYYNFLRGIWKDNTKMQYGGNAHVSAGGYGPDCDFMFPGDSDPCNWGTGGLPPNGPVFWTEQTAGNQPEDRRFMQSAGPFTLAPGAVNYITVGIPWAKANAGGPWASVELLRVVDDKCQILFDNCFAVVSGPNAPDLTVQELDKELIVYLTNRKTNDAGNNFNENYNEFDPSIQVGDSIADYKVMDTTFNFEGYLVYQLKDGNVSVADLKDASKARLIFQCDKKNGIDQIVNYNYDQSISANVPVEEVNGADLGIRHSFTVKEDAFTEQALVNHKQYYFLALAYGHNEYMKYTDDPSAQEVGLQGLFGQKTPFLAGRKNIKVYTGIPHITVGKVNSNSQYGDSPAITRVEGQGNGGNFLELTQETIDEIMSKPAFDSTNMYGSNDYPIAYELNYKAGNGPVNVKVVDPLNVKSHDYTLRFDTMFVQTSDYITNTEEIQSATWTLIDETTGIEYNGDTTIFVDNEQLFLDLGLSVDLKQQLFPTDTLPNGDRTINNGLIGGKLEFAEENNKWLDGIHDIDGPSPFNWIRSGTVMEAGYNDAEYNDIFIDPNSNYEKILAGTWAPNKMVASRGSEPVAAPGFIMKPSFAANKVAQVAGVDVVFTADKTKWTRCPILEMCPDKTLAQGGGEQFGLRKHKSVNVNGETDVESDDPMLNSNYIDSLSMGWFPGYAINVETGERLNMMFGEDSWLINQNGRDMKFNPTSNLETPQGEYLFGGKHYVYVMMHDTVTDDNVKVGYASAMPVYDAGAHIMKVYNEKITNSAFLKVYGTYVFSKVMWVGMPVPVEGKEWLSCDATVKLRVEKPYQQFYSMPPMEGESLTVENNNYPLYRFSTKGIATEYQAVEKAENDLDLINVVPNPYYGYSQYERDQLDNRIKITNLPRRCDVTIYTLSGTVIRKYSKDEPKTSIDWDLKNQAGIPIAGGVYLIHVDAPGIGEKVVKWFGALRPVDLNAF